jgi:hypothetical protein
MTHTRSSKEELESRHEEAADLLAEGWPAQAVTKQLADIYSVTLQQARAYTRAGKDLLLDSVGINNPRCPFLPGVHQPAVGSPGGS